MITKIIENFKIAPVGLKLIILVYASMVALDVISLIEDFSVGQIVGLLLALVTTFGFLFRWEAIRRIFRFLVGFFFILGIYRFSVSEKFRAAAIENAAFWAITLLVPLAMFFYLGRRDVKAIFKNDNDEYPTKAVDSDVV